MSSNNKKEKGFTIIEVVLVLAIAGLIFLVVFLALPALQRSQRDNQRRTDAARVSSLITSYQSNNNGGLPDNATKVTTLTTNYIKNTAGVAGGSATGELKSPKTNTTYAIDLAAGTTTTAVSTAQVAGADVDHIQIQIGVRCDGESVAAASGRFAVRVLLESGGTYCTGSQ